MTFGPESVEWGTIAAGEDIPKEFSGLTTWNHWNGLSDHEAIANVFDRFQGLPLTAEDILKVESRAKLESNLITIQLEKSCPFLNSKSIP